MRGVGYAFVDLWSEDAAALAISELSGTQFLGREIFVEVAFDPDVLLDQIVDERPDAVEEDPVDEDVPPRKRKADKLVDSDEDMDKLVSGRRPSKKRKTKHNMGAKSTEVQVQASEIQNAHKADYPVPSDKMVDPEEVTHKATSTAREAAGGQQEATSKQGSRKPKKRSVIAIQPHNLTQWLLGKNCCQSSAVRGMIDKRYWTSTGGEKTGKATDICVAAMNYVDALRGTRTALPVRTSKKQKPACMTVLSEIIQQEDGWCHDAKQGNLLPYIRNLTQARQRLSGKPGVKNNKPTPRQKNDLQQTSQKNDCAVKQQGKLLDGKCAEIDIVAEHKQLALVTDSLALMIQKIAHYIDNDLANCSLNPAAIELVYGKIAAAILRLDAKMKDVTEVIKGDIARVQ